MVAYSFQPRFVIPIRKGLGLSVIARSIGVDPKNPNPDGSDFHLLNEIDKVRPKRQTIRLGREGRGRHALPGETLQLYCRQRSPEGFLIGTATCLFSTGIVLTLKPAFHGGSVDVGPFGKQEHRNGASLDGFAQDDGFADWGELLAFWRSTHGDLITFIGCIIFWKGTDQ